MTDEERYLFDLRGYLVVSNVLGPAEVTALNALIDAQGLSEPDVSVESQRFGGFLTWDQCFRDLIDHPRILPYLKEMLGSALRLDHAYGIKMRAGSPGLNLHGGGAPYDPAQYYQYRNERIYCGLTVVTWALTDAREGHGGFCCIPGSHKSNLPCPTQIRNYSVDPGCVVPVPVCAGDVLIFTEALTHGTLAWSAPHHRRALLYKYSPGHQTWGRGNVGEEVRDLATEQQRLLLEPPYVYKRPRLE
jgi:ectoine hydroxylase-related dioxygenase (phytanoyl-CoA dioxygenase family)